MPPAVRWSGWFGAMHLPRASLHAAFEIADGVLHFDGFEKAGPTLACFWRRHREGLLRRTMSAVIHGEKNGKAVVHARSNCGGGVRLNCLRATDHFPDRSFDSEFHVDAVLVAEDDLPKINTHEMASV